MTILTMARNGVYINKFWLGMAFGFATASLFFLTVREWGSRVKLIEDDKVAENLYKEERVLCWVMTSPKNLDTKARAVRDTWAKRCNKVLFISSETNEAFPTIGVNIPEGRQHLTGKTVQAFRLIYEKYIDEADWFMKADDDTYVILENLRFFLTSFKKTDPVYFGHLFKAILKQGFYSGGAGYVLSKEALMRFGKYGTDPTICRQDGGAEDLDFGKCMENLGVKTVNTADAFGRSRFHCFSPETHLFGNYQDWYYQYDANGAHKGKESISDYAITFHYVPPQNMYALDFYIYHLKPYGIGSGTQKTLEALGKMLLKGNVAINYTASLGNRNASF